MSTSLLTKRTAAIVGVAFLGLGAVAVAGSASRGPGVGAIRSSSAHGPTRMIAPQGYDGSATGYELGAENDLSTNPFNVYGVEGLVPNDVGGVGVLGYGEAAKSYGVYGVTFGTNGIGVYGAGDGPTPAPGMTPSSTQQSTGVVGNSASGDGVYGSTQFPNTSQVGQVGGVIGADLANAGGENVGVIGTTTNGAYGVAGIAQSGAYGGVYGSGVASGSGGYGVEGVSDNSYGVYGSSTGGDGLHGVSSTQSGAAGISASGFGLYGKDTTTATPQPSLSSPFQFAGIYGQSGGAGNVGGGPGVYGVDVHNSGGAMGYGVDYGDYAGVFGYGNDGPGVFGYSSSDIGAFAANNNSEYPALYVQAFNTTSHFEIGATSGAVTNPFNFDVDTSGNLYTAGSITSGTDTVNARTRNPNSDAMTYAAQHTEATVEDFGSAQLVGGTASVPLAADFRQTIDINSQYMVFLTPYGENRGLFIASRTAAGFVVKEVAGGRSTISFDYRIVARPYGSRHARLPHAHAVETLQKSAALAGMRPAAYDGAAPVHPEIRSEKAAKAVAALHSSVRAAQFVPQPNLATENRLH